MVGRYPTIKLMSREPIPVRVTALNQEGCPPRCYGVLVAVSSGYPPDRARLLTRYAPLRRSPSRSIATPHAAPRLACVKPAASVHPEPGSNSSLYIYFSLADPDCEFLFLELTLSLIVLGTLLYLLCLSALSMIFSCIPSPALSFPAFIPPLRKGLQRYALFLSLQTFFELFLKVFHADSGRAIATAYESDYYVRKKFSMIFRKFFRSHPAPCPREFPTIPAPYRR